MPKLFLDGTLVESDSVKMPVESRGYSFGFGVFETMKFIEGRPCFFGEHIARLRRAVSAAGIKVELDEAVLRSRAVRLFESENAKEGVFKIVISECGLSTQLVMFIKSFGIGEESPPARLVSSNVRKASVGFTSRHKSLNYMESVLELERAVAAGYDECVFRNEHAHLTECAIANLFWIENGILNTPAIDCGLLEGIVRAKLISLARGFGIRVEEGRFSEADLLRADEVFLTSSGKGPRSVGSFTSSGGDTSSFEVELLPRLRSAYLELEKSETLNSHD